MEIGDYFQRIESNSRPDSPAQNVQPVQAVSAKSAIAGLLRADAGQLFEGTVTANKDGNVTIALANGQMLNARMEGNVPLLLGSSMFFQLKSVSEERIEIRPYYSENMSNPTITKALQAAGITEDMKSALMVRAMMEEQMPISKDSLMEMSRLLSGYGEGDVRNVVLMQKLQIPVTPSNLQQFENYQSHQNELLGGLQRVMGEFSQLMEQPQADIEKNNQTIAGLLDTILTSQHQILPGKETGKVQNVNLPDAYNTSQYTKEPTSFEQQPLSQIFSAQQMMELADEMTPVASLQTMAQSIRTQAQEIMQQMPQAGSQNVPEDAEMEFGVQLAQNTAALAENPVPEAGQNLAQQQNMQNILTPAAQDTQNVSASATQDTQNIPVSATQQTIPNGIQTGQATAAPSQNVQVTDTQLLQALQSSLAESDGEQAKLVGRLAASRMIGHVTEAVIEKQWMLEPQELSKPHSVNELYERMYTQIERMERVLEDAGNPAKAMLETVTDVKNNIDFMNQVNQMYQYVQIPLKLSGQNANSELYVFSNRRQGGSPDGTYRAFLHLELEHLGTTDVSVQLTNDKVSTHFYLEDEMALDLVAAHADELTKHLEQKGYHCTVQMETERTPVDFVDDFLMEGRHVGSLSRYSFDMRA
jgi:hypothetical protein